MFQGLTTNRAIWLAAGLLLASLIAAWIPVPPTLVERVYASGVFPRFQRVLTTVSNQLPFAFFDALILVVTGWWLAAGVRDTVRRGWHAVSPIVARTVSVLAAGYLVFLVTWGLNYRRVPLVDKLAFDPARVSTEAAVAFSRLTVARVNALHGPAHAGGWTEPRSVDRDLADAFGLAQRDLGIRRPAVPGRPKYTLFDLYFRRAAVSGMTDPYFLETLVASDLLPFERPFVVAHEWSHLAGLAEESDANFLGWLTCLRGQPPHQYSGWLFLYGEMMDAVGPAAARAIGAAREEGPRADLMAVRQRFLEHVSPAVQAAGWRAYDQYLKANQVEQGAASYGEVVRLVLGTRFSDDWVPALR